jgi:hypothetical protein
LVAPATAASNVEIAGEPRLDRPVAREVARVDPAGVGRASRGGHLAGRDVDLILVPSIRSIPSYRGEAAKSTTTGAVVLTAETGDSTEPQTRPRAGFSLRQGQIALLLVGLLFLLVQLVIVRHPLGLSQDEANYLAKVDPRVPELYWTQPRAWGMPVLAAPVAVFSPSLTIYRLYFGFLASAGLTTAFWPWLRVLRPAVAPAAALFFSTIWFTAAFGSLVMPNLYVGLGAVAVMGLFLRAVHAPVWWRLALTAAAAGFVALVRPTDHRDRKLRMGTSPKSQ